MTDDETMQDKPVPHADVGLDWDAANERTACATDAPFTLSVPADKRAEAVAFLKYMGAGETLRMALFAQMLRRSATLPMARDDAERNTAQISGDLRLPDRASPIVAAGKYDMLAEINAAKARAIEYFRQARLAWGFSEAQAEVFARIDADKELSEGPEFDEVIVDHSDVDEDGNPRVTPAPPIRPN